MSEFNIKDLLTCLGVGLILYLVVIGTVEISCIGNSGTTVVVGGNSVRCR